MCASIAAVQGSSASSSTGASTGASAKSTAAKDVAADVAAAARAAAQAAAQAWHTITREARSAHGSVFGWDRLRAPLSLWVGWMAIYIELTGVGQAPLGFDTRRNPSLVVHDGPSRALQG
jgi:hypothetical protein